MSIQTDIANVLLTEEVLRKRISELGAEITALYRDEAPPLLICVLKGAYVFLADLTRHIDLRHEIDFMETSLYQDGTVPTGVVRILLDLERNIAGRHVLIVEDIIDSGRTLEYITRNLRTRDPASLRVVTLLSKPARREIDVPVDLIGFEIPDEFVVGYGIDYAQRNRNLPYIGKVRFVG